MAIGVEQKWIDRTAVISVRGDIDALTAPQVTGQLLDVTAEQPSAVIVDFSGVEFLASAGITVLLSAHEYITSKVNA